MNSKRLLPRSLFYIFNEWFSGMSGAISVPFAAISLLCTGGERKVFACLAFVALLLTLWRLAYKCLLMEEQRKPKIKIETGPNAGGCDPLNTFGAGVNRFLRLKVTSECDEEITNCRAHLISIEHNEEELWGGDNAILTFAPGEEEDATSKTIHPGRKEYVDIICLSDQGDMFPGTKNREWRLLPQFRSIFKEFGAYRMTVEITGDKMQTKRVTILFTYTRNFMLSNLEIIQ